MSSRVLVLNSLLSVLTVCGSEIIRFALESRKGRAVWPLLRPLQHPLFPHDSGRAKGNLDNLLRLARVCHS